MDYIEVHDLEKCIITGAPAKMGGRKVGITGYAIRYYVNPGVRWTPEIRAEIEKGLIAKYPGQKEPAAAESAVVEPSPAPRKSALKFDQEKTE